MHKREWNNIERLFVKPLQSYQHFAFTESICEFYSRNILAAFHDMMALSLTKQRKVPPSRIYMHCCHRNISSSNRRGEKKILVSPALNRWYETSPERKDTKRLAQTFVAMITSEKGFLLKIWKFCQTRIHSFSLFSDTNHKMTNLKSLKIIFRWPISSVGLSNFWS